MTSIPNRGPLIPERWIVGATLTAVIALCWGWIAPMALDMYGPMTWIIFSLIATALQLGLTKASLLSPMMELRSRWLGGGLVLIAGAYQFTRGNGSALSVADPRLIILARSRLACGMEYHVSAVVGR